MTVEEQHDSQPDPKIPDRLRLLQTLFIVLGALCFLGILCSLATFVMGLVLVGMGSEMRSTDGAPMPLWLPLMFMGIGILGSAFYGVSMVLAIKAGRKLANGQSRRFCKRIAILACFLFFPLGTALGIYTLLFLEKPEVKSRFSP